MSERQKNRVLKDFYFLNFTVLDFGGERSIDTGQA